MAIGYLAPKAARLLAVGGLSGTGKTTVARLLAPELGPAPGAVILRSDVLRKRRFAVGHLERLPDAAYGPEANRAVYGEMVDCARTVLANGHAAIADAVFARLDERAAIAAAAGDARFHGIWLTAPRTVMLDRVAGRSRDASDADARIVELQAGFDLGDVAWRRIDASPSAEDVVCQVRAELPGETAASAVDASQ